MIALLTQDEKYMSNILNKCICSYYSASVSQWNLRPISSMLRGAAASKEKSLVINNHS